MMSSFLTILTGRNLPKIIRQPREPEPSIINAQRMVRSSRQPACGANNR
jgi:hypothetical protein